LYKVIVSIACIILCLPGCKAKHKVHFSGYTDTLYVYLSSPSMGYLDHKFVERGQIVKKNDPLYYLSPSPDLEAYQANKWAVYQARKSLKDLKLPRRQPEIMAIEYQLQQTKTSMARVEAHLNRLLKLVKKQFVDPDTIDNQAKTLEELGFQAKQLEENLKLSKMGSRPKQIKAQAGAVKMALSKALESKWYLEHKNMKAPADGYIFDTFYSQGELVPAQKPVLVMVVPENNYIEFFVTASDVSHLNLQMPITYQFYGDNNTHQAFISYISQTVEYMPPVLYTPDFQEELVYRIRAKPRTVHSFPLGQPVDVWT